MVKATEGTLAQATAHHPIAALFPMLGDSELGALAASIKASGQRDSIVLYDGKILDGRNRDKACRIAGVKPKTCQFKGTRSEAVSYVWDKNFHRRHLTSNQIGMALAERKTLDPAFVQAVIEPIKKEAAEAKATGQKSGGKTAGKGRKKKGDSSEKKVSQSKRNPQSRDKIAKLHGTNATTVAKYGTIRTFYLPFAAARVGAVRVMEFQETAQ